MKKTKDEFDEELIAFLSTYTLDEESKTGYHNLAQITKADFHNIKRVSIYSDTTILGGYNTVLLFGYKENYYIKRINLYWYYDSDGGHARNWQDCDIAFEEYDIIYNATILQFLKSSYGFDYINVDNNEVEFGPGYVFFDNEIGLLAKKLYLDDYLKNKPIINNNHLDLFG